MVLAYCGAVVRCVRHVYGDLHREDLRVQPFPRCRRCFFCRHAVMFELRSPECRWCLVVLAPLFCAGVWFCWLVLDAPSIIPVSIHASSAPYRLHTSLHRPRHPSPPSPSSPSSPFSPFSPSLPRPSSHIADLHTLPHHPSTQNIPFDRRMRPAPSQIMRLLSSFSPPRKNHPITCPLAV